MGEVPLYSSKATSTLTQHVLSCISNEMVFKTTNPPMRYYTMTFNNKLNLTMVGLIHESLPRFKVQGQSGLRTSALTSAPTTLPVSALAFPLLASVGVGLGVAILTGRRPM